MLHFGERSDQPEILDDFELTGHDLERNLRELEFVNRYLGGNTILRKGVQRLLLPLDAQNCTKVVDVGCGGGDTLRYMLKVANRKHWSLQLVGVDANARTIDYARRSSAGLPIEYVQGNALQVDLQGLNADVVCFNLFLHHFSDDQIVEMLRTCRKNQTAILINDLERSKLAYLLFTWVSYLARFSFVGRHDGKLSIKKAFVRRDWQKLLASAGIRHYSIRWKWAFRYLVLIPSMKT
jgi:2-polyprenyl-3-methyl-5-hydroxy-6-metoxy-1,4-benzoquinol methylase